jgi:hypothetical protein
VRRNGGEKELIMMLDPTLDLIIHICAWALFLTPVAMVIERIARRGRPHPRVERGQPARRAAVCAADRSNCITGYPLEEDTTDYPGYAHPSMIPTVQAAPVVIDAEAQAWLDRLPGRQPAVHAHHAAIPVERDSIFAKRVDQS